VLNKEKNIFLKTLLNDTYDLNNIYSRSINYDPKYLPLVSKYFHIIYDGYHGYANYLWCQLLQK